MRIISKKTLHTFWKKNADAEQPLKAWYGKAKIVQWQKPSEIKTDYRNASFIANNRVIFNIKRVLQSKKTLIIKLIS